MKKRKAIFVVSTSVDIEFYEKLFRYCEQNDTSISMVLRSALVKYMGDVESPKRCEALSEETL